MADTDRNIPETYRCSRAEIELIRKLLHLYMYEVKDMTLMEANDRLREIDREAGEKMSELELVRFRKVFFDG